MGTKSRRRKKKRTKMHQTLDLFRLYNFIIVMIVLYFFLFWTKANRSGRNLILLAFVYKFLVFISVQLFLLVCPCVLFHLSMKLASKSFSISHTMCFVGCFYNLHENIYKPKVNGPRPQNYCSRLSERKEIQSNEQKCCNIDLNGSNINIATMSLTQ